MKLLTFLLNLFGGGVLDRALDTVDRKIAAETDRDRLKGEIIKEHMRTRADWLRAGGIWTLLILLIPQAYHLGMIAIYNVHFCANCMWPKPWTIAAAPGVYAQYQGWIILAGIGGLGLLARRK